MDILELVDLLDGLLSVGFQDFRESPGKRDGVEKRDLLEKRVL